MTREALIHAINFMSRFAPLIREGKKLHTIRLPRKDAIRQGDDLLLTTGVRYDKQGNPSGGRLIAKARCTKVERIEIAAQDAPWPSIQLVDRPHDRATLHGDACDALARADGLANYSELRTILTRFYGPGPFSGVLIHWELTEVPAQPEQLTILMPEDHQ